jgi:hypothetical protein
MASVAIRTFCQSTSEYEALRARRSSDQQGARETRKAAEQLLVETLGKGTRAKVTIADAVYVVAVRERQTQASYSSASALERLSQLWEAPDAMRADLLGLEGADLAEIISTYVAHKVGGTPTTRLALEVSILKKEADSDLELVPEPCRELVSTLVKARTDLQEGQDEHKELQAHLSEAKKAAEGALLEELSQMPEGQIKKVSIVENDGSAQAYYLRIKRGAPPAKKKITLKCFKEHVRRLVAEQVAGSQTASLDRFCSLEYRAELVGTLKVSLEAHEHSALGDEPPPPRVALDRIRKAKAPTGLSSESSLAGVTL